MMFSRLRSRAGQWWRHWWCRHWWWRQERPARIQPDVFFTDPAAVEDDYGRMKPEPAGRW